MSLMNYWTTIWIAVWSISYIVCAIVKPDLIRNPIIQIAFVLFVVSIVIITGLLLSNHIIGKAILMVG